MLLMYDIKYLRHLKCISDLRQTYQYDLSVKFHKCRKSLLAINTNYITGHEILYDYTEVINDAIKNNERPAIILNKLEGLSYFSYTKPNFIHHDCREITVERAQSIIDANITAISNLNPYFNDFILISQINSTV